MSSTADALSVLDRLYSAVGEQQYTLASMGWNQDGPIKYSAAGARWEQYQAIQSLMKEVASVLERSAKQ